MSRTAPNSQEEPQAATRSRPRRGRGSEASRPALPPGQHRPEFRPVQDRGIRPRVPRNRWELVVEGEVERPLGLDWHAWSDLPRTGIRADLHCVTSWSLTDQRFDGVRLTDLLELARPRPEAKHLLVVARDGFSTNLTLDLVSSDEVLLADHWNGRPLSRDHGAPVRLVVPSRYGYKSAKWIQRITLSRDLHLGFQESRGYHADGDPWKEERFA